LPTPPPNLSVSKRAQLITEALALDFETGTIARTAVVPWKPP
jgi:hypothetical protein